jgi:single-strand DNA-binding protein
VSYQKITIVGNLGRDPEMSYLPNSGQPVTNFNVATNRQYTASNGERVKETTWFRVTAWGRQAETCNEYLHTGSQVLIEGRLTPDRETGGPRIWNRQDGTPGASFEVTADRVIFLSGRTSPERYESGGETNMIEEDDIPF